MFECVHVCVCVCMQVCECVLLFRSSLQEFRSSLQEFTIFSIAFKQYASWAKMQLTYSFRLVLFFLFFVLFFFCSKIWARCFVFIWNGQSKREAYMYIGWFCTCANDYQLMRIMDDCQTDERSSLLLCVIATWSVTARYLLLGWPPADSRCLKQISSVSYIITHLWQQ